MNRRRLYVIALFGLTSLAACAEEPTVPAVPTPAVLTMDQTADLVARSIAHAMSSEAVRADVLSEMRASKWVGHRLLLSEYLTSDRGRAMARLAATGAELSTDEFMGHVDRLTGFEILVPMRDHRLSWRGTANIGVAGTVDESPTELNVFAADGSVRALSQDQDLMSYGALFVIRPSETRGTRLNRQADVPGAVIQDPNDGETSFIVSVDHLNGRSPTEVDYGAFESPDELRRALSAAGIVTGGSPGGPAMTPPNSTRIYSLEINYGDAAGDPYCEIELLARYWGAYAGTLQTLRIEGIWAGTIHNMDFQLLASDSPSSSGTDLVDVDVRETDLFGWDDKGTRNFTWSDKNIARTIWKGSSGTAIRLNWAG